MPGPGRASSTRTSTASSTADGRAAGPRVGPAAAPRREPRRFPDRRRLGGDRAGAARGRRAHHGGAAARSRFSRRAAGDPTEEQVVAANIDTVFLVGGSRRRLQPAADRTLPARRGGERRDAGDRPEQGGRRRGPGSAGAVCSRARAASIPVHVVSCRIPESIEVLRQYLGHGPDRGPARIVRRGQVDHRQPARRARPAAHRRTFASPIAADGTRAPRRQLVRLPGTGVLIDTPGMRELQLWDTGETARGHFDDIETLADGCRFRDCRHQQEPGCAVVTAVAAGEPAGRTARELSQAEGRAGAPEPAARSARPDRREAPGEGRSEGAAEASPGQGRRLVDVPADRDYLRARQPGCWHAAGERPPLTEITEPATTRSRKLRATSRSDRLRGRSGERRGERVHHERSDSARRAEDVRRRQGARRRIVRSAARRVARPARSERRRQDDPDQRHRGPRAAGRRRDPDVRSRCSTAATRPPELGIVPQEIALYPLLTARENLEVFGALHGLSGADLARQVDWALERTGLADRARESVKQFSGGMRRRLNIACGVLHRPRIVLLDEPTVGVDPQSRDRIYDMLAELAPIGRVAAADDASSRGSRSALLADGHHRSRQRHRGRDDCRARRSDGRPAPPRHAAARRAARRPTPRGLRARERREIDPAMTARRAGAHARRGGGTAAAARTDPRGRTDGRRCRRARSEPAVGVHPPDRKGAARMIATLLRIGLTEPAPRSRRAGAEVPAPDRVLLDLRHRVRRAGRRRSTARIDDRGRRRGPLRVQPAAGRRPARRRKRCACEPTADAKASGAGARSRGGGSTRSRAATCRSRS